MHYGYQIENDIFWAGVAGNWEKDSINLWIELCKFSNVIFDLGANTGIYSLIAKTVNPTAEIYAFEPVKRIFKKLQHNISINNFNITAIEKAVSNYDGTAIIYDIPDEHVYAVTVNKNMHSAGTKTVDTVIETVTLNTFIRDNNIKNIDLIKIDVETHEPEVLEGFSDYLKKYEPTILIEILNDEIGMNVEKQLTGLNYLYFNINEKGGIRQVSSITKSDYFNYLICKPEIATRIKLTWNYI
ncbi:MAG: FkbM family methyltransferase [Bacteroidia bacterium]